MTIEHNPDGIGSEYLRCLNTCFPHWGGETVYRWCFERPMAGLKVDQMIIRLNGSVIAGSAVSYRTIRFPDSRIALAGIMTGSWTLPEARGQGCFIKMIEESVSLAAARGCAALLAFVTEDNPSRRQLEKAGALLAPSFYLFSDGDTPVPKMATSVNTEPIDLRCIEEVQDRLAYCQSSRMDLTRFAYGSAREFASQFIERPTETQAFRTSEGALAIVEKATETDRVQLLLPPDDSPAGLEKTVAAFLRHALQNGRKLFLFSTREAVRDICLSLGMRLKNGFVTMQPIDARTWSTQFVPHWDIESGDRI